MSEEAKTFSTVASRISSPSDQRVKATSIQRLIQSGGVKEDNFDHCIAFTMQDDSLVRALTDYHQIRRVAFYTSDPFEKI